MKIRILELHKNTTLHPKLIYEYTTLHHYELQIARTKTTWTARLALRPLPEPVKKGFKSELFAEYIEEPRAFAAILNDQPVGWLETGYEKWNNRMRVWELLVKKEHRRKGIGTQLMKRAVQIANEKKRADANTGNTKLQCRRHQVLPSTWLSTNWL